MRFKSFISNISHYAQKVSITCKKDYYKKSKSKYLDYSGEYDKIIIILFIILFVGGDEDET